MRSAVPAFLLCLLACPLSSADEANLPDGRRVQGTLSLDEGRWLFRASSGKESLPLAALRQVRFDAGSSSPLHGCLPVRAVLRDGSHLTGELIELDGKNLALRTAWARRLKLPRSTVAVLRQPPGWLLVRGDPLREKLTGWKIDGKPNFSDNGMSLTAPGQAVTLELAEPIREGRAAITFE